MKRLLLLIGLAALCPAAPATNVANAQAASWRIRIDNWGNPDKPGYWQTDDDVLVYLCVTPVRVPCILVGTIEGPTGIDNDLDIVVPSSTAPFNLAYSVQVGSTGDNLFVIDQVELFDEAGVRRRTYGIDNMKGYCVSQQSTDSADPACNGHTRICWWSFNYDGSAVGHNCSE